MSTTLKVSLPWRLVHERNRLGPVSHSILGSIGAIGRCNHDICKIIVAIPLTL